ncbi:DUF998 domain-containing protein [Gracilibacillus salitolerans]|uniref:DUF998 domain-containing protein n=1 Tax=Gracilibacillus salitolerans TaxID=2663022 RepID=A0A5Q2TF63_9BACI|nr:DUF998 domain-containing protein [Gracilibacillus salitolerans]QGH33315.1 DUF998 domain-containing protein [Gracilibacillus salitolerans]
MYTPYILMTLLTIIAFLIVLLLRNQHKIIAGIGFVSWISLSLYFVIEYIVIQATTASYNFLEQPMSDLGVTSCGTNTYSLAPYEICSPYHLLMNWTFTVTGIVIFFGAIALHQFWPDNKKTRIATLLLVIFGLSYNISGIIPADINFLWHTFGSIPGMIVQIPALILISIAIRKVKPKLAIFTFISTIVTTCSLIFLFYQPPFISLPGGLLQRILYGSIYFWMAITAVVLWRNINFERSGR